MKKLFLATSALTFTLLSAPSFAADSTADLNRKVQSLQDQLRAIQQQLDAQKATDAAQSDALAKEAATREAVEKAARDINLEQGGHTIYENGIAVSVPPVPAPAPKVVVSGANKFSLESADGQYSIALTGRIHLDSGGYLDFKPDSASPAKSPAIGPTRSSMTAVTRRTTSPKAFRPRRSPITASRT